MNSSEIIAIGSLIIALVGLVTGFLLQRESKKLREIERTNRKYRGQLLKALMAIKGYQEIEEEYARAENISVSQYRAKIRQDKQHLFHSSFLTPGNVNEILSDLQSE